MLNSSRFAGNDNLTFGVMGGKSGKIRQGGWQKRQKVARSGKGDGKNGKKWQGRRQKRQRFGAMLGCPDACWGGCERVREACLRLTRGCSRCEQGGVAT